MQNDEILIEENDIEILTFSDFSLLNETFISLKYGDDEKKNELKNHVFNMVQNAYKDIGGIKGTGFSSPEDMVANIPVWKVHRKNGELTSVGLYKNDDTFGLKRVALGTNGTPEGRKSATDMVMGDLKLKRAMMEVSKKSLSLLKKHADIMPHVKSFDEAKAFHAKRGDEIARPQENDEEVIRHPELKDAFYRRQIGDSMHTKILIGHRKPFVKKS